MPVETRVIHTNSVHRGMADKIQPWYLNENQAVLLQNLDVSKPGSRTRRLGAADIGGLSSAATSAIWPGGIWRAKDSTLTQDVLYAVHGGAIYRLPGNGLMQQRASGVSLTDELHAGHNGRWINRTASYCTQMQRNASSNANASKVVAITDDGQYSQCASMAPLCATWFQARLWCAGNTLAETEDTLWWSALNDGLSYSLTNSVQIEPGTGGRITGLLPLRGDNPQLVVFKERAICIFEPRWGSSSAFIPGAADALDTVLSNVRVLTTNCGCIAAKSIQYIPGSAAGDIIFLSLDGFRAIRRTDQDVAQGASLPLSDTIKSTIARINWTYATKSTSAVVDGVYHCAVPLDGATSNNYVLSYDLINQAWFLNTWGPRDLVAGQLAQTKDYLWMQYGSQTADCSVTGLLSGWHNFKCFTGSIDPNGAPIQFREDGRGISPSGDIGQKHAWDWVGITVKNEAGASAALTVLYNIDQNGWVTAGSLTFDAVASLIFLGADPLPWAAQSAALTTKFFNLNDAPPGFEIQIRYVSEDSSAQPSVQDVFLKARLLGYEFDNTL